MLPRCSLAACCLPLHDVHAADNWRSDYTLQNQSYGTLMFCAEAYGTAPLVPYLR